MPFSRVSAQAFLQKSELTSKVLVADFDKKAVMRDFWPVDELRSNQDSITSKLRCFLRWLPSRTLLKVTVPRPDYLGRKLGILTFC